MNNLVSYKGGLTAAMAAAALIATGVVNAGNEQSRTEQSSPRLNQSIDGPTDQATMGYGTDGIAEDASSPSLGSRSMMGSPEDSAANRQASFKGLDSNDDGALSRAEVGNPSDEAWNSMDANGNGSIDRSEFSAFELAEDATAKESD